MSVQQYFCAIVFLHKWYPILFSAKTIITVLKYLSWRYKRSSSKVTGVYTRTPYVPGSQTGPHTVAGPARLKGPVFVVIFQISNFWRWPLLQFAGKIAKLFLSNFANAFSTCIRIFREGVCKWNREFNTICHPIRINPQELQCKIYIVKTNQTSTHVPHVKRGRKQGRT